MERRFAVWQQRHPRAWSGAKFREIFARAERLEERVCTAAGIAPRDVRRLRWVAAALAQAEAR
jgi:hypothetical protein